MKGEGAHVVVPQARGEVAEREEERGQLEDAAEQEARAEAAGDEHEREERGVAEVVHPAGEQVD